MGADLGACPGGDSAGKRAADPFTLSYTGCGGLVLVTADDPEMHSSQNEQ
jgi:TPP-dependent indolepyruvate ferredoxin oxidoreductase alpha subunit